MGAPLVGLAAERLFGFQGLLASGSGGDTGALGAVTGIVVTGID